MLFNGTVNRHIRRRTMMLGPIEFNATGDPWTGKSDKSRLNDMVIINKVTQLDLVVCHLYTATKFGKYHHLYILILNENSVPFMVGFLIGN